MPQHEMVNESERKTQPARRFTVVPGEERRRSAAPKSKHVLNWIEFGSETQRERESEKVAKGREGVSSE